MHTEPDAIDLSCAVETYSSRPVADCVRDIRIDIEYDGPGHPMNRDITEDMCVMRIDPLEGVSCKQDFWKPFGIHKLVTVNQWRQREIAWHHALRVNQQQRLPVTVVIRGQGKSTDQLREFTAKFLQGEMPDAKAHA